MRFKVLIRVALGRRTKPVTSFAINLNKSDGTDTRGNEFRKTPTNNERVILARGGRKAKANVTSDSYFGSKSYRNSRRHSTRRGGFGPPASRDVCRYSFLSIFDRVLQRGRTTSASTSRTTPAVMATPYRIRERLDQRSKRAEKIVQGNRARILRLFVKQDVTEIQELVYFAGKNAEEFTERCDFNFLT